MDVMALGNETGRKTHKGACPSAAALAEQIKSGAAHGLPTMRLYQSERIDGHKAQRIKIVWNCIGEFTPPVITDNEKSA